MLENLVAIASFNPFERSIFLLQVPLAPGPFEKPVWLGCSDCFHYFDSSCTGCDWYWRWLDSVHSWIRFCLSACSQTFYTYMVEELAVISLALFSLHQLETSSWVEIGTASFFTPFSMIFFESVVLKFLAILLFKFSVHKSMKMAALSLLFVL